jgi:hypothetical protein
VTDDEWAGTEALLQGLLRNTLDWNQRLYLVDELIRLWFPKAWGDREREKRRQKKATQLAEDIRRVAARDGIPLCEAAIVVADRKGLASAEALTQRIKRARREARRYKKD